MEECLAYFRKAVHDPASVPPWSEWWAANAELVERIFPLFDFVRLKHRRLFGARQLLQNSGELPKDFTPSSPSITGACGQCGERMPNYSEGPGGSTTCSTCDLIAEQKRRVSI